MVEIDVDKAVAWLDKGAQPSERAQKILEISGAWAQWRSTKGEVVSIPQPPEEKIKSSSKANKKQQEENLDEESNNESSEESSDKEEE